MHPSLAHAIASGIQDPDWRLTDPEPGRMRHAADRLPARPSRPGIHMRVQELLAGRRAGDGEWLPGLVPPLTGYPSQR